MTTTVQKKQINIHLKPKIKPSIQKRGDRIMSLETIQQSDQAVDNPSTLNGYRVILNAVNRHFGWETDKVYYDRLNKNAEEIAQFSLEKWKVGSISHLRSILNALSSFMTRTGWGSDHNIRSYVRTVDRKISVPIIPVRASVPVWEDVQLLLSEIYANDPNSVVGKIAAIFSYGYVLRVGEIFNTKLVDDGESNYLDLNNGMWYIRKQKNRLPKTFNVDPGLCSKLRGNGTYLLSQPNGKQYCKSARLLKYHGWKLPSNNDLRKSYETWNIHRSGRSDVERLEWHNILGHSATTVADFYDMGAGDIHLGSG